MPSSEPTTLRPLGIRVVVEKDAQKPLEVGGILIPECLEKTPRYGPTILGTVRGIGGQCRHVKVGDRVALKAVCGDDYFVGDRTLTVCREKDLVGLATE